MACMDDMHMCLKKAMDRHMNDMDIWTNALLAALIPPLLKAEPVTDDMLSAPDGVGPHAATTLTMGDTEFLNPKKDSSCGNFPAGQFAALKFTQLALPIEDLFISMNIADVEPLLKRTQLGKTLPKANVDFDNPTSDEGLTRQAFYGLACHRLEEVPAADADADDSGKEAPPAPPENAVFQVDLLFMKDFEVRGGFARYGACAYFDQDQKPVAIRTAQQQDDENGLVWPNQATQWEVAKFAWRSSLITLVTAVDHLYNLHFCTAAQMLRASSDALPAEHPIKRALQPFLMRTALINNKAGTALLPRRSILHHITAFTWDSLCKLAATTYKKGPEWQGLKQTVEKKGPKVQELIKNGKLPYYQDGLELYDIYYSFFETIVAATDEEVTCDTDIQTFWKLLADYTEGPAMGYLTTLNRESLLSTLSTFCFLVTAQHEHVGTIMDSVKTPIHGGFRITHNAVSTDKQCYVGGLLLLAVTSLGTPSLQSNFSNYWQGDEEKERWQKLQQELAALSERIDDRNKTRLFEFQSVNPKVLECAVSI